MTANRNSMSMTSISEMMNPAMASPLGLLNIPINEKTSPRTHIIHPKTGTHPKIKVMRYEAGCSKPVGPPFYVYRSAVIVVVNFHGFSFNVT